MTLVFTKTAFSEKHSTNHLKKDKALARACFITGFLWIWPWKIRGQKGEKGVMNPALII